MLNPSFGNCIDSYTPLWQHHNVLIRKPALFVRGLYLAVCRYGRRTRRLFWLVLFWITELNWRIPEYFIAFERRTMDLLRKVPLLGCIAIFGLLILLVRLALFGAEIAKWLRCHHICGGGDPPSELQSHGFEAHGKQADINGLL